MQSRSMLQSLSHSISMTDETTAQVETNNTGVITMTTVSRAVQNMHAQRHKERYIDKVEKQEFFNAYQKETDKNKKIEMLRKASKEGWL
jgi:hypothetical protein